MDKKHKQWEQKVAGFHSRILIRLKCDQRVFVPQYKSLYFRIFQEAYESGFCAPLSYNLIYNRKGCNGSGFILSRKYPAIQSGNTLCRKVGITLKCGMTSNDISRFRL
jgi:hypothetical protein